MNISELFRKYDIHPKKSLGQNFLIALPTIDKIVRYLNPSKTDKILEIGPGIGLMTRLLTEQSAFVAAMDTDPKMVRLLENEMGRKSNLHIIHGDILATDLNILLKGHGEEKIGDKWLFMGNIPYNITSPIIFHIRKFRELFKYGVLMMQKEVANRLTARPFSKEYGILSVAIQAVADVEKGFTVSPASFIPEPKVMSSVIKISFLDRPRFQINDFDNFTAVVRAAFSTRRKKIKNALAQSAFINAPKEAIEKALNECGISENARAEELDVETFAKLSNILLSSQ